MLHMEGETVVIAQPILLNRKEVIIWTDDHFSIVNHDKNEGTDDGEVGIPEIRQWFQ